MIRNSLSCGPKNFSPTECHWYGFMGGLCGSVSIACISMLAFQRYRQICVSLVPDSRTSSTEMIMSIAFCWLFGFLFSGIPLISEEISYKPEGFLTSCFFDYLNHSIGNVAYILLFGTCAYLFPLLMISFFYYKIVRKFQTSARIIIKMTASNASQDHEQDTGEPHPRPKSSSSSTSDRMAVMKIHQESKLVRSVTGLVACWFISWTPYAVIVVIGLFLPSVTIHPIMSMIPALFSKCSSIVNPYIYFISNPRLRKNLCQLLRRKATLPPVIEFQLHHPRADSIVSLAIVQANPYPQPYLSPAE